MSWTPVRRLSGLTLLSLSMLLTNVPTTSADELAALTVATGGTPGSFQFKADGFDSRETLTYTLTGPSQQTMGGRQHTTNGQGAVAFEVQMPRSAEAGLWTITVKEEDNEEQATATFAMPALGPDIDLAASQVAGPTGVTIAARSSAFDSEEVVGYWLTGPDGKIYLNGTVDATKIGRVSIDALVTDAMPRGEWKVTVYGHKSDHMGVAAVTIS